MNSDAMSARIESVLGSPPGSRASSPGKPPPSIPNHELLAHIGGGSYGEVWLARSVTGALRAVKIVWRCHFSSDRPYEREFRGIVRFEPISRSHPGVVNVLHVGRDDAAGCFFYVMELADNAAEPTGTTESETEGNNPPTHLSPRSRPCSPGKYSPRSLASELKTHVRLSGADAAALGVQLAGALGHLHRHGLVHRDVKPSNVIFVGGQPKLADIGLVTGANEERSFVGTEGFIPPEGPGSERADLFALGRLLYEAATGKNRCDFPSLPGDLDRWPKGERESLIELNAVLARACAPDAKDRHSNAAELASDLNLILAGRSVRRSYRVERRLRQARWICGLVLALVMVATFFNWLQHRQREQSDLRAMRETALRKRAEAAENQSQQQLYTALLEQARATVLTAELGQRVRALDAVRRAAAITNSAALRGAAISALALPDLRFERDYPIPSDLTLVTLDPAFKRIALCRKEGPVEIRSMSDQQLLATLPANTNRPAYVALWSPDGRFLSVKRDARDEAGLRADVEVWDTQTSRRILSLHDVTRDAMAFHPRLPRLMVGTRAVRATIWDLNTGREIVQHELGGKAMLLKFSPDGSRFAALHVSKEGWRLTIHRTDDGLSGTSRLFPEVAPETSSTFEWDTTGHWIAVTDRTGAIHWMDAETGETRVLGRHKAAAVVAVFSPDGKYLFTGGWDRELICWDVRTSARAFTISLDSYRMQFRSDGGQCAILRWPETRLQLYAFEQTRHYREFAEDLGGGRNLAAFSPDGRCLAACGAERLAAWELASPGAGAMISERGISSLAFAPDNEIFASRTDAGFRWHVAPETNSQSSVKLERLELANTAGLTSLCLVPNGVVFTGGRGSTLAAFDQLATESAAWTATAAGLNGSSPDGRWLGLYRSYSTNLCIYRLPGLERVVTLTQAVPIGQFAFSPLGNEVATASSRGVQFWSTANWQQTRCFTNFTRILYSPDAQTLWLSTSFRSGGLYDARTAEPLLPLPAGVIPLALSPDGRHLAVSQNAHHVQLWDLQEVRRQLQELGLDWAQPGPQHR